ncbi:MAG: glycosyltransferase [Frankia sp.]
MTGTVLDCAGARMGGAHRLVNELDRYLRDHPTRLEVVGRGRALTGAWLIRREASRRMPTRVVALNNVSYQTLGRERRVLVHNALHFLTPTEASDLGRLVPRSTFVQGQVIRESLRRADTVWVPSSSMAERVIRAVPTVAGRLAVRHNPLSPPPVISSPAIEASPAIAASPPVIASPAIGAEPRAEFLCPVLPSPYKKTTERLAVLLEACDRLAQSPDGIAASLVITANTGDITSPEILRHPRLRVIGHQELDVVHTLISRCTAVIFPFELESFGYPLAEARVLGVPVVALQSAHNQEIAGQALVPYQRQEPEQVAAAMFAARTARPPAETGTAFSRDRYFDELLG